MVVAALLLRQSEVPGDLAPLALGADAPVSVRAGVVPVVDIAAAQEAVVLAVGGDDLPQPLGLPHGLPHHGLALDAPAIVGEARRIGCHGLHVRQGFAPLAPGDGPVGVDVDRGVPGDDLPLDVQRLQAVGNGVQVGHGAHMGVAAPGGVQGAGADGFLIRKSRLSKMDMDINETGKYGGMMKINGNSASSGLQPPGDRNNAALRNGKINRAETVFGKQQTVFQQILQGTRSLPPASRPALVSQLSNCVIIPDRRAGCQYGI